MKILPTLSAALITVPLLATSLTSVAYPLDGYEDLSLIHI